MAGRISDEELKEHVRSLLQVDKDLRGYGLNADVVQGEVQLQGIVDTLKEKERAEKLASSIPGVKGVANAISISTDGAIRDRDVATEVTEELATNHRVDLRRIGVAAVDRGTVVLKGHTDDPQEIEAARTAAASARGVTDVVTDVKPEKKEPTLKDIFHNQVRNDKEEA